MCTRERLDGTRTPTHLPATTLPLDDRLASNTRVRRAQAMALHRSNCRGLDEMLPHRSARPLERDVSRTIRDRFRKVRFLPVVLLLAGFALTACGSTPAVVAAPTTTTMSYGVVAACNSDTKTVDVAAQAFLTENPSTIPANAAAWEIDLLPNSGFAGEVGQPTGFITSWPQQGVSPVVYTMTVAGTAETSVALTGLGASGTPNLGDVIVTIPGVPGSVATPDAGTYNATTSPSSACQYV
jgi:hypothetical protein